MTEAEVTESINALYQSRLANDVGRCLGHLASNANFRVAGSLGASPIAKASSAPASMRQQFTELIDVWEWQSIEPQSLIIHGNRVASHYRLTARHRPSGTIVNTEMVDLITIENGRVTDFLEFLDTAMIVQVAARTAR